jgi:hypothetical protein
MLALIRIRSAKTSARQIYLLTLVLLSARYGNDSEQLSPARCDRLLLILGIPAQACPLAARLLKL